MKKPKLMSSTKLEHKHLELYVFLAHKINTCEKIKVLRVQELVSGTEDWVTQENRTGR